MAECRDANAQEDMRSFNRIDSDSTVEILFDGEKPDLCVKFKDWSVAGACLVLKDRFPLPSQFRIRKRTASTEDAVVNCELVWQARNEAGVRFKLAA